MEGDEDEDDVDDIEHEFKMEEEKDNLKISYGEDDENTKSIPVVLAKVRLSSIYPRYKEIY